MNNFLHQRYYNNSLYQYLCVIILLAVAYFVKNLISKYFATILFKLVARTGKKLDKFSFISLIVPPLEIFLFLLISFAALDKLNYPSSLNVVIYKVHLFQAFDVAAITSLVITFTWLCLRMIDFIATILEEIARKANDNSESQLVIFFKDFFKVIIAIIGFLLVLRFGFNIDIASLITGLSIIGAAIALATKESLENLIASFILFFDRPFTVGDLVKVNNITGTVEKIGLRSSRLRTEDKTLLSVPNKQMVDSSVENISLRTQRRVVIDLNINLNVNKLKLNQIINKINVELKNRELENLMIFLKETGKTAHIVEIIFFTSMHQTVTEFLSFRQDVNLQVIKLLQENDIPFAASTNNFIIT